MENDTIRVMRSRRSVRTYTQEQPAGELIEAVVRAGQQAPFASQLYSVILSRKGKNPFGAPLLFTILADFHKLERFMALRGWDVVTNDLSLLLFGIQDAAYMAENMVIAAESVGMGSCFLGGAPFRTRALVKKYHLPKRVLPVVQLVMGYPAEDFPPRPRYPLAFTLFEDRYPEFSDDEVRAAMQVMDEGYLEQEYYKKQNVMIELENQRPETFTHDDYSWSEHISRKWGQWFPSNKELLEQLEEQDIHLKT